MMHIREYMFYVLTNSSIVCEVPKLVRQRKLDKAFFLKVHIYLTIRNI